MKRILLSLMIAAASFSNAQVLQSEDFNGLTLGNVGSDFTGMTVGQDNWYTASNNGAAPTTSTNAGNSNFQIVATGAGGTNGLKIVSPDGNKGSRFMWKDGLAAAWAAREAGNEIFEVEYDMYTGPATTSTAQVGVRLYGLDGANARVLAGYVYNMNTRVLQGVAYLNNAGTLNTYLVNLVAAPGLVLTSDTWYRIGFAYDTTTGEVIWKAATAYTGLNAANWIGPFDVDELDFVSAVPATPVNSATSEIIFDGLTVKATVEEALLGVNQTAEITEFSVFPNPANNVVSINSSTEAAINAVEIFDLNGRTVKSVKVDNLVNVEVNVSDLAQGVYTMKISSDNGTATKKVIKQ